MAGGSKYEYLPVSKHNSDSHHTSAGDSFNSKPEHRNTIDTIYNIYLLGSGGHHGTQHQPPPRPGMPLPSRRAQLSGDLIHAMPRTNKNICAAIIKIFAPLQVRVSRGRVSVTAGATLRLSCRADTAYKRCVLVSAAGGIHNIYTSP